MNQRNLRAVLPPLRGLGVRAALAIGITMSLVASAGASTSPTTIADNALASAQNGFVTIFIPSGQALVLAQGANIVAMNANGTNQSVFATLPSGVFASDIVYDAPLNMVLVSGDTATEGEVFAYSTSGALLNTLDVTADDALPNALAVLADGNVLLSSDGGSNANGAVDPGMWQLTLDDQPADEPPITLASSEQVLTTAVNGVAVDDANDVYVCTPGALDEYSETYTFMASVPDNVNCVDPVVDGDALLTMSQSTTAFFTQQLTSVSTSTNAVTVMSTISSVAEPNVASGLYTSVAVMPTGVIGGTAGHLLVGELAYNKVPGYSGESRIPSLFATGPTGSNSGSTLVALGYSYGDPRYVSVTAGHTGTYYVVDQFGGTVTAMSVTGADQVPLITNFRVPDFEANIWGKYPVAAAIDPTHHYVFVLDSMGDVYRFPSSGGTYSTKIPHLAVRQVGTKHSTSPLEPTALALNGSVLYLGFTNVVYSESEKGSKPKTVTTLASGDNIVDISHSPSGGFVVTAQGSTGVVRLLSSKGATVTTLELPAGFSPVAAAEDSHGHVFVVSTTGQLDEIAASGGTAVDLMSGGFTGVATDSQGNVVLTTSSTVQTTTATDLGV